MFTQLDLLISISDRIELCESIHMAQYSVSEYRKGAGFIMNDLYHIPSSPEQEGITILNGYYESRYFEIVTFKGHPNVYISFPEGHRGMDCKTPPLHVHGGITFLDWRSGKLMLGWNYAHSGDFDAMDPGMGGRKWSLTSIFNETISAIEELNAIC